MPPATATDPVDLGDHYARTRQRLSLLLADADADPGAVAVPACPGWDVHDVVAHLVGNIEDGAAGRIRGVPTEAQTEDQVRRHRGEDLAALLATWDAMSPLMEAALAERGLWAGLLDAVTHEHDIRAALGRPGARQVDTVRIGADRLAASIDAPIPVAVAFPDGRTVTSGVGAEPLVVRASPFEVLRLRLGRRSRAQVAALDWSADPEPVLDHLFVFGPSPLPQDEPG